MCNHSFLAILDPVQTKVLVKTQCQFIAVLRTSSPRHAAIQGLALHTSTGVAIAVHDH